SASAPGRKAGLRELQCRGRPHLHGSSQTFRSRPKRYRGTMVEMAAQARRSYLLVLAGAVCCYAALGAVVRIIPGYVGTTLGLSAVAVGFAVGAPALTAVVARPGGGRLADRRGPRGVVVGGAIVAALGALPMFVESYPAFVVSRLAVGVGEGAMMSASVL